MWKCKECSEEHEDQFETCWKCESFDGKEHFDLSLESSGPEDIRNGAKLLLSICSVIFGLSGVTFGVMLFIFSGMVFDSPNSESNPLAWLVFVSMVTFSPMCLISIVVSWSMFSSGSFSSAKTVALAPFLNIVLLFVAIFLGSIFS